jgi:hypothetical protein
MNAIDAELDTLYERTRLVESLVMSGLYIYLSGHLGSKEMWYQYSELEKNG